MVLFKPRCPGLDPLKRDCDLQKRLNVSAIQT